MILPHQVPVSGCDEWQADTEMVAQ